MNEIINKVIKFFLVIKKFFLYMGLGLVVNITLEDVKSLFKSIFFFHYISSI